jgi:hypothetical protein
MHTRPFVHRFLPILQSALESIVDQRVQLVRIRLDKTQVENSIGIRIAVIFLLPFGIFAPQFAFIVLDVFQSFFEVVLASLSVMALFFNEFKRSQPEPAILVGLSEESNGLSFGTQSPNGVFV